MNAYILTQYSVVAQFWFIQFFSCGHSVLVWRNLMTCCAQLSQRFVIRLSRMTSGYRPAFRCGQGVWGFEARVQSCINSFFSFCCWYSIQVQILRDSLAADEDMSAAPLNHWLSLSGLPAGDVLPVGSQRVLDSVVVCHIFKSLVNNQTTQYTPSQTPGLCSRP